MNRRRIWWWTIRDRGRISRAGETAHRIWTLDRCATCKVGGPCADEHRKYFAALESVGIEPKLPQTPETRAMSNDWTAVEFG